MNSNLAKLIFALFAISPILSSAQRGKDNNYIVTTANTSVPINTYTNVIANVSVGATSLSVANNSLTGGPFTSNLAQGDLIMIIQMQGASMDIDVTPTVAWGGFYTIPSIYNTTWGANPWEWGQVTNYNQAGKFEQVEVLGASVVSGVNTITLSCPLQNSYVTAGHVQVVRIPRFNNLTVNTSQSITPPAWNGTIGGVVAVEVNGNIVLNAGSKISASAKGFRGGALELLFFTGTPAPLDANTSNGGKYLGSYDAHEGAEKGEGIGGFYTEYDALYSRYSRGAPANGGGGAAYQNCGGGGGSNVGTGTYNGKGVPSNTTPTWTGAWNLEVAGFSANNSSGGGRGGYSYSTSNQNALAVGPNMLSWGGEGRKSNGGFGGHPLAYDATRLFMGGGGGAGDQDSGTGEGGAGSAGGGIVFITCYGAISGSGSIESDGAIGQNSNPLNVLPGPTQKKGNDGAGGGGAGGSIYIKNSTAIQNTIALNARGGNGGNHALSLGQFVTASEAAGPGGAGSGGCIAITSGGGTQTVTGGTSGTTNSAHLTEFTPNGATNGASGISGLPTTIYNIIPTNASICGNASANLSVTVSGTSPGAVGWYTQQFGGLPIATGTTFTTPILSTTTTYYVGVCPGTFRVPVIVTFNPKPVISGTAVLTNPSCLTAGSISGLSVSGGTPAYTIAWTGTPQTNLNPTNLSAGSYTLTVTDVNNCTATSGPYTLIGVGGPVINTSAISIQNQSCSGTLGSITGITTTGVATLVYSWSNGGGSNLNATNLAAGNYTLTVTDGNGCTANSGPHTIGNTAGPSINATGIVIASATCGNANGAISGITASGTGLSCTWNGTVSATTSISGQNGGNYTLLVTDVNGCTATSGPFTIPVVAGPTINAIAVVVTNETCNQANGSLSGLTISGGSPAYTIAWTGTTQTSINPINLSAGSYTLTVTDQNSCTVNSGPYTILNTGGPIINQVNVVTTNVLCDGTLGSVTGITATGAAILAYSWSNGGGSNLNTSNLSAGNYILTVTDGNGCSATSSSYSINAPVSLSIDATNMVVTQTSCTSNTGSISGIIVSGGINPVISWSNSANTLSISGLAAGSYTLTVTDNQGCTDNIVVPITMVNAPIIDVSSMLITAEHCGQQDASVSGISVSGGTPSYMFLWNNNGQLNTADLTGIAAGSYTLVVTDSQGCSDSETITITEIGSPIISDNAMVVQQVTCSSFGSISGIIVNGISPYTYSWTGTSQTSLDISNLSPGTYTLSVTDVNGCSSSFGPTVLAAPTGPTAGFTWNPIVPDLDQDVLFTNTSSGSPISVFQWTIDGQSYSTEDVTEAFSQEGDYLVSLVVIDVNGCIDTVSQIVSVYGVLVIPNVLTINGDNINESFNIVGLKPKTALTILNRWGNVVFNTDDYQNDWKGKDYSGKDLTEGVYTYLLKTAESDTKHGFVHLMR